jgi:hypothetical protein
VPAAQVSNRKTLETIVFVCSCYSSAPTDTKVVRRYCNRLG